MLPGTRVNQIRDMLCLLLQRHSRGSGFLDQVGVLLRKLIPCDTAWLICPRPPLCSLEAWLMRTAISLRLRIEATVSSIVLPAETTSRPPDSTCSTLVAMSCLIC